jgi:hypothetical protein
VDDHLVGEGNLSQGAALPPRLAAGLATGPPRSDLGAGLSNPSLDGGLEEFREEAASRRFNSAISASCSTIRARSWAMTRSCAATSAASCS